MLEEIGGMRPWPTPVLRDQRSGPRPISGFEGQFSGLMPEQGAAALAAARIQGLSEVLGIPEQTAAWLINQNQQGPRALRQALAARSGGFTRALEASGAIPSAADVAGAPLGEILMQAGEVREDPLNRALRSLNAKIASEGGGTFVDEGGYERDLESGAIVDRATADPVERPIDAATLSADELAALLPNSRAATTLPYAVTALSPAERRAAFQESGASKTRGGQRNALSKEPNIGFSENARDLYPGTTLLRERREGAADPDARYAWFTPGGVAGAGIEPNPASAAIQLLIAPNSQERADRPGQFQAPSIYMKNQGGFATGLADARILDLNPLAQLSPQVASELEKRLGGSFFTFDELDKSETGGYAGRATNAPIPDPATGGGGFDPVNDPGTIRRSAMASRRPMTVAEAFASIATRNLAPISPVFIDQLTGSGQVVVTSPKGEVSSVDVFPLGIPPADERDLAPIEQLRREASRRGTNFVDARVGSKGRYRSEMYDDLNQLIGVLASEAFPDARARFQLQSVASGLDRTPVTVENRFQPVVVERPVGADWSLLINTANRDPLITEYQQKLLAQAGIELPADRNPLISLVDNMRSLAGVPAPEVAVPVMGSAAQRVSKADAVLENALRQAKVQANRGIRAQMIPGEGGSGLFAPDTNSRERLNYEQNARSVLTGILAGTIPLGENSASAPSGARTTLPSGGDPNGWIEEMNRQPRVSLASPGEGRSTDLPAWKTRANPGMPSVRQQRSWSWSPESGFVMEQNAVPLAQRSIPGLQVPYSATGFTPDPVDQVASYMATRARAQVAERDGGVRFVGPPDTYQYEIQGLRSPMAVRRRSGAS